MSSVITRERQNAKRIALYSHKGGVGKTTLSVNLAFALASMGKSVLLVDSDPQCNLSAYLLDSAYLDKLLDESDGEKGKTLWSMLLPIAGGRELNPALVEPMQLPSGLFLCPGDIKLSEFEEKLSYAWQLAKKRDSGGFASVTAVSLAINSICAAKNVDFVFYDCGPNIGALNRCILVDCDAFLIPAACDEFSIRALSTLGSSMVKWLSEWRDIADLAPDGTYLPPGNPLFLGYILQRFKVYGGAISASSARYVPRIEQHVQADLVAVLKQFHPSTVSRTPTKLKFGEVRDLSELVSSGQSHGTSLWQMKGGNADLKTGARIAFLAMAKKLIDFYKGRAV